MLYAIFPILAAALYGLGFVYIERALEHINVATYMFWGGITATLSSFALVLINRQAITLNIFNAESSILLGIGIALVAPALGWLFTSFAIKETSASYAAFAEISYPLFTVLFLFLIFGVRQFDWTIILGGSLVILGSAILVAGQIFKSQAH